MQRGKLALELTQGFRTGAGNEMAVVLEGGMRYDNGDGINGASAEVGGGLRYTNSSLGLTAEGRGRFVISARAGYEEWGMGGTLMFDPATRGQGLSIRLAPSYGDHMSGVNQLWERGVHDAVGGHNLGMGPNVDGEVAYGIAGFHGTPYSGFYVGQGGTRAFSERRALRTRLRGRAAPRGHAARERARRSRSTRWASAGGCSSARAGAAVAIGERPRPVRRAGARFR